MIERDLTFSHHKLTTVIYRTIAGRLAANYSIWFSAVQELREGEDSWSLSELVQAITILVHFHCLSSFVFGCGITPEIDLEGGHTFRPPSLTADQDSNGVESSADEVRSKDNKEFVALMKTVSEKHKEQGEVCVEKIREEFENIASDEGLLFFLFSPSASP